MTDDNNVNNFRRNILDMERNRLNETITIVNKIRRKYTYLQLIQSIKGSENEIDNIEDLMAGEVKINNKLIVEPGGLYMYYYYNSYVQ